MSNICKYQIFEELHDCDETLYHQLLVDHIEMAPLIYTKALQAFSKHWHLV